MQNGYVAFMRVVNWLVAVLCGISLILWAWERQSVEDYIAEHVPLDSVPLPFLIGGIVIIALNIFLVAVLLARRGHVSNITFGNEAGQTSVSLSAVEDVLERALKSLSEVEEAQVDIRAASEDSGLISVTARGSIIESGDISTTTEKIQQVMRERFESVIRVERNVSFDVHVQRFRAAAVTTVSDEDAATEETESSEYERTEETEGDDESL